MLIGNVKTQNMEELMSKIYKWYQKSPESNRSSRKHSTYNNSQNNINAQPSIFEKYQSDYIQMSRSKLEPEEKDLKNVNYIQSI